MKKALLRKDYLLIALLIVIALALRLYKINSPLADLGAAAQTQTATVARHFVRDGFDLTRPAPALSKDHDIQTTFATGMPLYQASVAGIYKLAPYFPLEVVGRATTIFFSLILLAIIYYLVHHEVSRTAAFFAALLFAVFPFFVFLSRVVTPDIMAVTGAFISLFFLYLFSKTLKKIPALLWYTLSVIFFSAAIITMPTVAFFLIAAAVLFGRKYQFEVFKKAHVYAYFLLIATPLALLYLKMQQYAPVIATVTPQNLQEIFFKPGFFKSIFFDRVSSNMLGGYLTSFLILAIVTRPKRYFLHALFVSILVYLFLFQGPNITHEYYQTLLLPVIAALVGVGISRVIEGGKSFITPAVGYPVIVLLIVLSFYIAYDNVRGYYYYSPQLPRIASVVASITSPTDKIVTDTQGDTTLLYLSDRTGVPSSLKSLDALKDEGYSYFVTLNRSLIEELKRNKKYEVAFEDQKNFAVFKL